MNHRPRQSTRRDQDRFPVHPWRLTQLDWRADVDALGQLESVFAVGNGYLGMRGNPEEGRDAHTHGTYVNGFHETWEIVHAESAFGLAKTGQSIVNVPDAKLIKLYVDDEPLVLSSADLVEYERTLDFRAGVLIRSLVWRTPSAGRVRVRSSRMVSLTHRHLAVLRMEVTLLDEAAAVVISSQLLNREDMVDEYRMEASAFGGNGDSRRFYERVLEPRMLRERGNEIVLGYRCRNSGMTLTCGTHHSIDTASQVQVTSEVDDDLAKTVFTSRATPGEPISLTKLVAYHTSRGIPTEELADRCSRTLERAAVRGIEQLEAEQRSYLDLWWQCCDVKIDGDDALQQATRFNLFHLAQASARVGEQGVPARGVTGRGSDGHYCWDSDIYIVPFLSYTAPKVARELLRFRWRLLDSARRRAGVLNQTSAALYPWRTINGEEAFAAYQIGTAQRHINADVVYGLKRYMEASGDYEFLAREGAEILTETARMWIDLGVYREKRFHILGVTGPDEYTTSVDDNLFTNVMASINLRYAAESIDWLQSQRPEDFDLLQSRVRLSPDEAAGWRAAGQSIYIGYEDQIGVHPQDAGFLGKEPWDFYNTPPDKYPLEVHFHPEVLNRFQVSKLPEVMLAAWLAPDYFTLKEKRANFEYYSPIATGDSPLSSSIQTIVAAEVGYLEEAKRHLEDAAFMNLSGLNDNTIDGLDVASMAGAWAALVCGYGGLRSIRDRMYFNPKLPHDWGSLSFPLTWHGRTVDVQLTTEQTTFALRHGDPIPIYVGNVEYTVTAEAPLEVPIGTGRHTGWFVDPISRSPDIRRQRVFVSYAREDRAAAERLEDALIRSGIEVWRDVKDLWVGDDWKREIRRAIQEQSLAVAVLFSQASTWRDRSYQREEILLAIDEQRKMTPEMSFILPVRLDDCELPDYPIRPGQVLADLTWVDLFPAWDDGLQRFLESVRRLFVSR